MIVEQERQPLYVQLSDETIRNRYKIHIVNKTEHDETYRIAVKGIPADALDMGHETREVTIRPGKDLRLAAKIDLGEEAAKATTEFEFVITAASVPEEKIVRKANFYSQHQEHHKEDH